MEALKARSLQPFIPSGSDFGRSRELFLALGFEVIWEADGYAGLRSGEAAFILQDYDKPAFAENLMLRIEVTSLDAWWQIVEAENLVQRFPGFRINPPAELPWGRESQFVDLAGVCWHVAEA